MGEGWVAFACELEESYRFSRRNAMGPIPMITNLTGVVLRLFREFLKIYQWCETETPTRMMYRFCDTAIFVQSHGGSYTRCIPCH